MKVTNKQREWGAIYEVILDGDTVGCANLVTYLNGDSPEINWSAIGSQSPERALEFANGILRLHSIANRTGAK